MKQNVFSQDILRGTGNPESCRFTRVRLLSTTAAIRWDACLIWKKPDISIPDLQNPTNDAVAAKICDLEGGAAAMLTSSGQAANFYAIMNIVEAGDHIVCASALYGGTYNLYAHTIRKMGVEATFVDPECTPEELDAAFQDTIQKRYSVRLLQIRHLTILDFEKFAKGSSHTRRSVYRG